MKPTKFWEANGSHGHIEMYLRKEYHGWEVRVDVDGTQYTYGEPNVLPARYKKLQKLPAEAYASLGKMLLGEANGKAVIAAYEAAVAAAEVELGKQAETLEPTGYRYVSGCDAASTYDVLFPEDTDLEIERLVECRLKTDLIERHLHDKDFKAVAEATGAEVEKAHLMSWGGWCYNVEGFRQLLAIATERQAAIDAKSAEKKAVADTARAAKIQQARDTGKPVELERWSEPCDGSQDECDLDIVSRVVMPDGKIVTHRGHTH